MTLLEQAKQYIEDKGLVNASAGHINLYPTDGNHIEIRFYDLDFKVQYGLDTFYFDKYRQSTKRKMWYAIHNNEIMLNKGFRTFEKAIEDGIKELKKEAEKELLKLNKYQQNVEVKNGQTCS